MKIRLDDKCSPEKIVVPLARPIYRYYFSKKYYNYRTFKWEDTQILIIKYITKPFGGKLQLVTEFFIKEKDTWELIKTRIFYHLTTEIKHYIMMLNISDSVQNIYSYVEEVFRTRSEIDAEEIKNLNNVNCIYKTRAEFFQSAITQLKKLQGKPND